MMILLTSMQTPMHTVRSPESITVVGEVEVDVEYGDQHHKMNLVIVHGHGPSLFGAEAH